MTSNEHLKQIRRLSIALFLSGAFNILLGALFFVWLFYDRPLTPYFDQKPPVQKLTALTVSPSNADLLRRYKAKTYDQLIPLLEKNGLVEDGFRESDLALGVLVAFHEFDLERALGNQGHFSQKRILSFDEGREKVIVYPNLTKQQFGAIMDFIKTEKWPLKPKGLFLQLNLAKHDQSLYEAFYLTPEFASMEALFKGKNIAKEELAQMMIEGGWGMLLALHEKQKTVADVSDEHRQKVLLAYLKEGSKGAASILLKSDFDFASKRLSDQTVLSIIPLITENSSVNEQYLSTIAGSPRGDHVKTFAIKRYQELIGKSWEPLISRKTIAVKPEIIEKAIAFPKKTTIPAKKTLLYIVQDGDTLWKIAKRFKVSVDEIRSINVLKSDSLKTGTPLKIPDSGK